MRTVTGSKHAPALPLYTEADAERAVSLLQAVGYERPMPLAADIEVDFLSAGHLLGSAYARVRTGGITILFGGDLGRYHRPVLPDPVAVEQADYLLVESTYGDRVHEDDSDGEQLASAIRATVERGGKVIVPAFAIGRVEELLFWIARLEAEDRIPVLPVYLDSPMALRALERYRERLDELDPLLQPEVADDKAPHDESAHQPRPRRRAQAEDERRLCAFCTRRFQPVETAQESKQVTASRTPAIVISSSGMATGGRVLHHLRAALPDRRNTVLLVGFQAEGTRGRQLLDGAPALKIHGQQIPVHAQIDRINSMSAHADSSEILRWLSGFSRPPRETFLVHGEGYAMEALGRSIQDNLGWRVHLPRLAEAVTLES